MLTKYVKAKWADGSIMSRKVTGIVAYFTWVGWLIAFLAGDKEGAKFHLNQALVLWLFGLLSAVFPFLPFGGLLSTVYGILLFVGWILGLIAAVNEEEKEIPLIGQIKILK